MAPWAYGHFCTLALHAGKAVDGSGQKNVIPASKGVDWYRNFVEAVLHAQVTPVWVIVWMFQPLTIMGHNAIRTG